MNNKNSQEIDQKKTDFSTLSTTSNELGKYYLNIQFPDYEIVDENITDTYSPNDFLVKSTDGSPSFLVEVKVRRQLYETAMLERDKFSRLLGKAKLYISQGVSIGDIYYYNIVDYRTYTTCYYYKFSDIRKKINAKEYFITPSLSAIPKQQSTTTDNRLIITSTYCPLNTAVDGDTKPVSKDVFYLPISMATIINPK